jgi:O-antigen ligase
MASVIINRLVVLLFGVLLCAGTLFASSASFVSAQVAPKWYCFAFGALALLVALAARLFFPPKSPSAGGMLAWLGAAAAAACTAQALCGVLQYAGALPAVGGFRVTGSFDNPAGFAACLCAGFPFALYFFFSQKSWRRYLAAAVGIIVVAAVALSASRAGLVSLAAVGLAVFFFRVKMAAGQKVAIATALLLIALSGLYLLKKDSANGRLLIWRCSWEMVKDKPLLGHGYGGFKAHYMDYQASYFGQHPDSEYAALADNVNRPFNEYVLLLTDFGLAGFALLIAAAGFLWKSFLRCRREKIVRAAAGCLLSVAVFALFSYPLCYPFVWVMLMLSVAVIVCRAKYSVKIFVRILYPAKLLTVPATLFFAWVAWQRMANEMRWCKIAHQSLSGKTEQMLPEYEQLHPAMSGNELFLYNYTAELNVAGHYGKSLQIGKACEQLLADYDLQMLMADSYERLKQYEAAAGRYKKAAAMCPVKFMPLYKLAKLHEEQGNIAKAQQLARLILEKKVKIPSPAVAAIKREMQQLVERGEMPTPAQGATGKPLNTEATRQGEAPEVQPRGSALPP